METFYNKITLTNEISLIMFKEYNFWDKMLNDYTKNSKQIDIVTYNMNFTTKFGNSVYLKLKDLTNRGININLIYATETAPEYLKPIMDDWFRNFVLCGKEVSNHSKMFISDEVAFIGSANFSFSSNNNYECGVLIKNPHIIKKIRQQFIGELIDSMDFLTSPFLRLSDPLQQIDEALEAITLCNQFNSYANSSLFLQDNSFQELNYLLRLPLLFEYANHFELPLEKYYMMYDVNQMFDEYGDVNISPTTVKLFDESYLNNLQSTLIELRKELSQYYQSNGRNATLYIPINLVEMVYSAVTNLYLHIELHPSLDITDDAINYMSIIFEELPQLVEIGNEAGIDFDKIINHELPNLKELFENSRYLCGTELVKFSYVYLPLLDELELLINHLNKLFRHLIHSASIISKELLIHSISYDLCRLTFELKKEASQNTGTNLTSYLNHFQQYEVLSDIYQEQPISSLINNPELSEEPLDLIKLVNKTDELYQRIKVRSRYLFELTIDEMEQLKRIFTSLKNL